MLGVEFAHHASGDVLEEFFDRLRVQEARDPAPYAEDAFGGESFVNLVDEAHKGQNIGMENRKGERRMRFCNGFLYLLLLLQGSAGALCARSPLVLQSDFGTKDGAVAAMKGVAVGVEPELKIYDLTHEIPTFNVWEGAYRLWQTAPYWSAGTVFVSVVDPGVGTARKSVVARAKNGQYFVTPDNGTLTLIAEHLGIDAVREIDEKVNRRPGSEQSYTFHGRDVYAYTGARLAAGVIQFEEVGPVLDAATLVKIGYEHAKLDEAREQVIGTIPVLDPQYGNVWTNIDAELFARLEPAPKSGDRFRVTIDRRAPDGTILAHYEALIPYARSFGDVPEGQPLLYLNSLMQVSFALNQRDFAATNKVAAGPEWRVVVRRDQPLGQQD